MGYSHTKECVFGYKLHLTYTTGEIVVSLTADVTTVNMPDNQVYIPLVSSISVFSLHLTCYMVVDPGYYDKEYMIIARKYWE
jgi:hypothetical protein